MADPEQIYQEVLTEEQQKGSAGPVAEGRAKAARARAEHGSPHPKEPKWWPGAQPQFEGDGAAPAAEEPAEEPEEVAEPEPEPTPEPEPAPTPAAEPEPEPAPATEAPAAAAPAAAAPEAQPAAAATPTQLPPDQRPPGVTHGVTTGTRLRPEDEATSDAQFEGQEAVNKRRKVIDELIASGVPEVAAAEAGGPRSPWLAVLYLIIPFIAIAFLVANTEDEPAAAGGEAAVEEEEGGGGEGGAVALSAASVQFDTDEISIPAEGEVTIAFDNADTVPHNVSVYPDEAAADAQSDAFLEGELIDGGASTDYTFESPGAGEYVFQCDVHPSMRGTALAE